MLDEQRFRIEADVAMSALFKKLTAAADLHDFEPDLTDGALKIEFEDPPAKFVVSPNAPVRQVWVSAHSRSFKLDWSEDRGQFVLADGRNLEKLIQDAIREQIGAEFEL